jgi:hypothetical protein
MNNTYQTIKVIHRAFEDLNEVATVAKVTVYRNADLEANVDFAWRVTQNIEGSWSKGEYLENGDLNEDFSEWVETIAPLEIGDNGKVWGHRSSSQGDVYVLDTGEAYVVGRNKLEQVNLDEILKLDGRASIKHLFN